MIISYHFLEFPRFLDLKFSNLQIFNHLLTAKLQEQAKAMQQRLQVPQEVLPMAWERIYPRPGGQKSSTLLSAKVCFFLEIRRVYLDIRRKVKDTPPYKIMSFWFVFIGAIQQLKTKENRNLPWF